MYNTPVPRIQGLYLERQHAPSALSALYVRFIGNQA